MDQVVRAACGQLAPAAMELVPRRWATCNHARENWALQARPTAANLIVDKPVEGKLVPGKLVAGKLVPVVSELTGNPAAQVTLRMAGMVRRQQAMDRTSHQAQVGHQARMRMASVKAK